MLLRFENEEQLKQYFNEEDHTLHRTDNKRIHRLSGAIPKDYPVILQSGPAFLTKDTIFRPVQIQRDYQDELLIAEAKGRQLQQETKQAIYR